MSQQMEKVVDPTVPSPHLGSSFRFIPYIKRLTPNWELATLGKFKILIMKPNNHSYGLFCLDLLVTLQVARHLGAWVYLVRPRPLLNRAVFHVRLAGARVMRGPAWLDLVLAVRLVKRSVASYGKSLWVREVVKRLCGVNASTPTNRANPAAECEALDEVTYLRRRLLAQPAPTTMAARHAREAASLARRLGILPTTKLVTLHLREDGFKLAMRQHPLLKHLPENRFSRMEWRNQRIDSYLRAIDFLMEQGFVIVRIGDATMVPIHREGIIDLATSPMRSDLLELYCMMRSEFFIGSDSGTRIVTFLTNTPSLAVNVCNPISIYPIRQRDRYILKRVVEKDTGRVLSLSEMLGEEYLKNFGDCFRYDYLENTAEEILLAVKEMLAGLSGSEEESHAQRSYRELATTAATSLARSKLFYRKHGADNGFLGHGKIVQSFVERYLYT